MRESEGTPQYPDANSTMRLTYGTVGPVSPKDAVHYDSRSTIDGYLEKYNPDDYEFRVDDRDVFAHPQQGLGPLGRKRPAVRQFPHQQRHHGRQFGTLCSTPGAT